MTISTKHYIDLKYAISDCLQRDNWTTLFELCRTNDVEVSKTIAAIFPLYDPKSEWGFVDYVASLSSEERLHKWESVATVCYILGKIGNLNPRRAISDLRIFLSENRMLRSAVMAALSNIWVMNSRTTSDTIFKTWVLKSGGNEDLQEVAVKSCEYLASNEPSRVSSFLRKVSNLARKETASEVAKELISKYLPQRQAPRPRPERKKFKRHKKRK